MAKPLPDPAYQIPLTDDEFILIGRTTAAWSQTEFLLEQIICLSNSINHGQLMLFSGNSMMATKTDFLKDSISRMPVGEARQIAHELTSCLKGSTSDRNVMTHGMWGINTDSKSGREAGAISHRRRKRPLAATELRRVHDEAMRATLLSAKLLGILTGRPFLQQGEFYFGNSTPKIQPPKL